MKSLYTEEKPIRHILVTEKTKASGGSDSDGWRSLFDWHSCRSVGKDIAIRAC